MTDITPKVIEFHRAYCEAAKCQLVLSTDRLYWWQVWMVRGFTVEDLRLVCCYLWAEIRADRRRPGSLKFSNLIQEVDRFEEDLAFARQWTKKQRAPVSAKDRTLEQWRGQGQAKPTQPAKPVKDYIAALRRAAQ